MCIILVSHLKRPEGKGHEEGSQVSLSQLRGSSSLASLADSVIAFERNQQDEIQNNVMKVRVLKNRWSGDTGIACNLIYNKETGRLTEGTFDEWETSYEVHSFILNRKTRLSFTNTRTTNNSFWNL